jgi:hypothetical protein
LQNAEKHVENDEITNSAKFLAEEEERPKTKHVRNQSKYPVLH